MQTAPRSIYRWGPFTVDTVPGELLKLGKRVRIQDQAFRLLLILLDNAGQVVTRAEIQSRIWEGNTFVEFDSSLRVAVGKLREALEDEAANPHYIETIPKRGYRFLASVVATETQPDVTPAAEAVQATAPLEQPGRSMPSSQRAWVAGVLLVVAAGAGAWLLFARSHTTLSERDTLVLADLDNKTGDAVFDGTLRQGLAIQLEQSPFLRILDDEQVQRDLRLMNVPPGGRITIPIAHDICVRDGAAATIDGSIANLGKRYERRLSQDEYTSLGYSNPCGQEEQRAGLFG